MRDYLYIWHNPEKRYLVASGLEFKDFLPCLKSQGGIVLFEHDSATAELDYWGNRERPTNFEFVRASDLPELAAEDIYSWGDFQWADYAPPTLPSLSDQEIAEFLFLAHMVRPLREDSIPTGLGNQFFYSAHDDGWYLRLFYTHWNHIEKLLSTAIPATLGKLDLLELKRGHHGFWLEAGETHQEEKTDDIDKLLNRR